MSKKRKHIILCDNMAISARAKVLRNEARKLAIERWEKDMRDGNPCPYGFIVGRDGKHGVHACLVTPGGGLALISGEHDGAVAMGLLELAGKCLDKPGLELDHHVACSMAVELCLASDNPEVHQVGLDMQREWLGVRSIH